jgi:uncharacterized protein (TIGR02996 family)
VNFRDNPEWKALMRRICEEPEADLPRLVLADWLLEHGDEFGSAIIQFGVENPDVKLPPVRAAALSSAPSGYSWTCGGGGPRGFAKWVRKTLPPPYASPGDRVYLSFHRGLPGSIVAPIEYFHADHCWPQGMEFIRCYPIVNARVTDRLPDLRPAGYVWSPSDERQRPGQVSSLIPTRIMASNHLSHVSPGPNGFVRYACGLTRYGYAFDSPGVAVQALSRAIVDMGRECATKPDGSPWPLPPIFWPK